jgi:hypothetical protein
MKVERRQIYVSPAVADCRVELEGVVAVTAHSIGFSSGTNNIGNWQETELGDVHSVGEGGDVYISSW